MGNALTAKRQDPSDYASNMKIYLEEEKAKFEDRLKNPEKIPMTLDDFERLKTIGTGSFGRVMLCQQKDSKDYYAMKILNKKHVIKMKQREQTLNELKLLQALRSQYCVGLRYHFKDNSNLFMILDYIPGGDMASLLQTYEHFSEPMTRFYAAQTVLALEYLHNLGIIYRDLKPENLLIDRQGYIKMTDFGFAKRVKGRTWTLCGTTEYMAPELVQLKGYTKAIDWWALGILIHEMAIGYSPFYHEDRSVIPSRIASGKVRLPAHLSSHLKHLLRNLLQIDPAKRYGNLRNSPNDIKYHQFFNLMDWVALHQRKIDGFFLPKLSSPHDTSNFEVFKEEDLRISETEECPNDFADF